MTVSMDTPMAQTFWEQNRCVSFGGEILSAGIRYHIDPVLLAAVAAQESGGPSSDSGSDIIGDHGHGFGLFQIDNRAYADFAENPAAMVPAFNTDFAASIIAQLMTRYGNNTNMSLTAYNSGLPGPDRCGSRTSWPDSTRLCYAESVMRHRDRIVRMTGC
jgi:hypothetical protein